MDRASQLLHPTKAGLFGVKSRVEKHKSLGWGGLLQLARLEVTAGEFSVQPMELEEPEEGSIDEYEK